MLPYCDWDGVGCGAWGVGVRVTERVGVGCELML